MKALSRPVALLRKVGFKHYRADLVGKLAGNFEIERGKLRVESLQKAVDDWLVDQGFHARDS